MESINDAVARAAGGTGSPSDGATEPAESVGFDWAALVLAETGPGALSEYVNHPLNVVKSEPLAQVIRGVTGLAAVFGVASLRLALLDIVSGLFALIPRRAPAGAGPEPGGFPIGGD